MAHRLNVGVLWVGLTLLGCAGVALAYLPPRGAPRDPWAASQGRLSQERLRAAALAAEWRAADQALRLAQHRERLRPVLARRRDAGDAGSIVEFASPFTAAARERVLAALDTVWRHLDLGLPKVSIAIIVGDVGGGSATPRGTPGRARAAAAAFLVPDSTDRHTCVAFAPLNYWTRQLASEPARVPETRLREWMRSALGVCAFYAAMGSPGREIEDWLIARRFDVALVPQWDAVGPPVRSQDFFGFLEEAAPPAWFWRELYAYPFAAVGCVAGKEAACRAAILAGSGRPSAAGFVTSEQWWRQRRLVRGGTWMSDLLHEVGRSRARRFWSSELSVDSAFHAGVGSSIAEWTRAWQAARVPVLRFGAAPPLDAAGLAVVLAGLCLAAAALSAMRREVS